MRYSVCTASVEGAAATAAGSDEAQPARPATVATSAASASVVLPKRLVVVFMAKACKKREE